MLVVMNIALSPVRLGSESLDAEPFEVVKRGSSLWVNGEEFNFSPMQEGSTLPAGAILCDHFAGPVNMVDGIISLTLRIPLPGNFSQEQAFPEPLLNVPDGPVALPKPLPTYPTPDYNSGINVSGSAGVIYDFGKE